MAEAGDGQGQDPKSPAGQGNDPKQEPKNDPYKVFETEEDYKSAQDKFFRGAYNEGSTKVIKDAKSVLGVDIDDYEDTKDFFSKVKEKIATSSDNGEDSSPEIEELRSKVKEYKQLVDEKEQEFNSFRTQQKVEGDLNRAISAVKQNAKELSVKEEHLKRLFQSDYNVKLDESGNTFVERSDGTPVLDGEGNRQDVADVLSSYVKEYGYAKPKAEGAGGGTGAGSVASKPQFSKFKELMQSPKPEDNQAAMELRAKAKEHGWDDDDSPQTASQFKRDW